METKSVLVGVVITLLVVGGIGGLVYGLSQSGQIDRDTPASTPTATPTPSKEPINDSEIPPKVNQTRNAAAELKRAFMENQEYEHQVLIDRTGRILLSYNTSAETGDELKKEMKEIAVLYATEVAANHPKAGSLLIHTNGVLMTVPSGTATAYGEGDINKEAFFKNVRFDTVGGNE